MDVNGEVKLFVKIPKKTFLGGGVGFGRRGVGSGGVGLGGQGGCVWRSEAFVKIQNKKMGGGGSGRGGVGLGGVSGWM